MAHQPTLEALTNHGRFAVNYRTPARRCLVVPGRRRRRGRRVANVNCGLEWVGPGGGSEQTFHPLPRHPANATFCTVGVESIEKPQRGPIAPEDEPLAAASFERLSEESRYRRFFTSKNELSAAELAYGVLQPALIEDADDERGGCRRAAAAIGARLRRPLESPPLPALRR